MLIAVSGIKRKLTLTYLNIMIFLERLEPYGCGRSSPYKNDNKNGFHYQVRDQPVCFP